MSFEDPDQKTFRCLTLAFEAAKAGGTAPAVLNAANDLAVEAFLSERLPFYKIPQIVEKVLERHQIKNIPSFEQIIEADSWSRDLARRLINNQPS